MSKVKRQNRDARRAKYAAKQEEAGSKVVKIIFAVLVVLALLFMCASMYII